MSISGAISTDDFVATLERVERTPAPVEPGQAEVLEWGDDVTLVAYGTLLPVCVKAAARLRPRVFMTIRFFPARSALRHTETKSSRL